MSAATLSGDILSICLLFAKGDIQTTLGEITRRAEDFQEKQRRFFGISPHDFQGILRALVVFELGLRPLGENIDTILFSEIISPMLSYHDAYFNDEGEHWCGEEDTISDTGTLLNWFDYSLPEYRKKQEQKRRLQNFFHSSGKAAKAPGNVRRMMKELKIDENILYHCSRPMI